MCLPSLSRKKERKKTLLSGVVVSFAFACVHANGFVNEKKGSDGCGKEIFSWEIGPSWTGGGGKKSF